MITRTLIAAAVAVLVWEIAQAVRAALVAEPTDP